MMRGRPVLLLLAALSLLHLPSLAQQSARAAWRLDGERAPVEVREGPSAMTALLKTHSGDVTLSS